MQRTGKHSDLADEVITRCQRLARFSDDEGSTRRTFLSPSIGECHREISRWMEPFGAQVRVDAAGNFRGFYPGEQSSSPRLILGSHLDTVPNAGAYDGTLGVVLAITLLQALEGRKLNRQDEQGISVRKAIQEFGLNPEEISRACLDADTLGYIEFHIEQGPVLEELGRPLGVVEAIAGQSRVEFTFVGRANHAGTTPMHLRYDAMAAAAEWIGAVEHATKAVPGAVGTVGKIEAKPGATNVIAGMVHLTLDVRHRSDEIRTEIVSELIRKAEKISERRGLTLRHRVLLCQQAVPMDGFLIKEIDLAIRRAGCVPHRMVSGAGHDAMILAEKIPAAMVFLRTPGGISHDPAESVIAEDVDKAIECGLHLLDQLAASPVFQKRKNRA